MTEIQRQTVSTTATHITLFEDRAQVEREVTVSLQPGSHILTLKDITRFIDDQSLVVKLTHSHSSGEDTQSDEEPAPAELGTSRIERRYIPTSQDPETSADELEIELKACAKKAQSLRRELERSRTLKKHLKEIESKLLGQMQWVPDGEQSTPSHFAEALATLDERMHIQHEQEYDLINAIEDIEHDLGHTSERLTAARHVTHKLVAQVELQLECTQACELHITLIYMTGCALWRPAHRARLERQQDDPSRGRIVFDSLASVWQTTGETWEGVTCSLSTARPTQQATPPLLNDDILYSRQKTDYERRVIDVSARDEVISNTGAQGARMVDDMPGVDDGGEPLLLQAQGKVNIPSTGDAHTLQLDTITLPCTVDVVAMPEISEVAHLRAKTIWSHTTPLLAGPVILLREQELAGNAALKFIAPGEPLDLGFGTESALRIRREVERKHIDKKLTRRRHEARHITLHISNTSAHSQSIHIVERIPVSEIEQVHIHLTESEGAQPDQDGFLTLSAHLGPNQNTKHKIVYELDLDPKVRLDF